MPTDAQCQALSGVLRPLPFATGETLEFDIDALGAQAGTMVARVLPPKKVGQLSIEVSVETNSFFSKVRRVRGTGTSTVEAKTLRPLRYLEESRENDVHRTADVTFTPGRVARLVSTTQGRSSTSELRWGRDVADVASAIFVLRSLPFRAGQRLCLDVYAIRRMWRVWGTVLPPEPASVPLGEYEAWHLAGEAARLDAPDALELRREVHVWVSDDTKRLPLAVLGTIDLGTVRATLKAFERPGEKSSRVEPRGNLTW